MDLADESSLRNVLETVKPDVIFHLAAQAQVPLSWKEPVLTIDANITGSIRLFMLASEIVPSARFIFIGSGDEYGTGCDLEHPFDEITVCKPQNPYAVSKYSAGMILAQLAEKNHSDFIHLRPFNHFGPGQREGFVISDFCAQIARIEKELQPPLMQIGCLDAMRDFSFVSDIVAAYVMFAEAKEHKHIVYNLCTGIPHRIQDILDCLLNCANIPIRTEINVERYRKPENPILYASNARVKEEFGWSPVTKFTDGLLQTLNDWRRKV
jgi:GDP-4-dehydro-6-deoxy-D-mannose reductase